MTVLVPEGGWWGMSTCAGRLEPRHGAGVSPHGQGRQMYEGMNPPRATSHPLGPGPCGEGLGGLLGRTMTSQCLHLDLEETRMLGQSYLVFDPGKVAVGPCLPIFRLHGPLILCFRGFWPELC